MPLVTSLPTHHPQWLLELPLPPQYDPPNNVLGMFSRDGAPGVGGGGGGGGVHRAPSGETRTGVGSSGHGSPRATGIAITTTAGGDGGGGGNSGGNGGVGAVYHPPGVSDLLVNAKKAHDSGDLKATVAMLAAASEAVPTDPFIANDLGAALQQMWRLGEAATALRRAVELNPTYAVAMNNLGKGRWTVGPLDRWTLGHLDR